MAKSRPDRRKKATRRDKVDYRRMIPTDIGIGSPSMDSPDVLLSQASTLLQTSQPQDALSVAQRALTKLEQSSSDAKDTLPAIKLLADISVELGDIDQARSRYLHATTLDPDGTMPEDVGGGADKFLWLAQLCEEGGATSVEWFERGIQVLRQQIEALPGKDDVENKEAAIVETKDKMAQALCGIAEVYMTDLSWDDEAESRCDAAVTEAVALSPGSPEPLQTLASVRISQLQFDEARAALRQSLALWKDLPPEDAKVPAFPTRISLARLLLETEMEEEALGVLERLVADDDQSIEAWYLGGWCLFIQGEKTKAKPNVDKPRTMDDGGIEWRSIWKSSREWLENSLKLYGQLEYEDERLQKHATELVGELHQQLGSGTTDEGGDEDAEEEWEDQSDASGSDQSMVDA